MRPNINKNSYENELERAYRKISDHMFKYWKDLEMFEETGDTWFAFRALYHEDAAKRIARDWNVFIESSGPKTCFIRFKVRD